MDKIILKFDVEIGGLPVAALRPELRVRERQLDRDEVRSVAWIEKLPWKSAFASYSRKDERDVLGRVRSCEVGAGIDVFTARLSIKPGEKWKRTLQEEIVARDVFWLFWSRNAMKSKEVDWEWRTALREKSIDGIKPHPLEPVELAPPPKELSDLQFGGMYEWHIEHLRES